MVDGILLSQPKYVIDLLDRLHMSDRIPSPSPFQFCEKLTIDYDSPFLCHFVSLSCRKFDIFDTQ